MKNLKILSRKSFIYEPMDLKLMVQHAFDNNIFFIYENSKIKMCNNLSGDVLELHELNNVVSMEFLQLNESLCLATKDGQIVTIELNNNNTVEVVGLINDGIEEMKFSPDQELVVIISS
jgi:hypothetical protein